MRLLALGALLIPAIAAAAPGALTDLAPFRGRIHVAHVGASGNTPDKLTDDATERRVAIGNEYVVIEERPDAVRLAIDDDDARQLIWIPSADAAWTVARPTRIVGRGASGVWMLPGAPIEIAGAGRRVAATFNDDNLTVRGTIARSALAHVYTEGGTEHYEDLATTTFRREPDGPVLVRSAFGLRVRILERAPRDWRLVEHRGRHLRIVGWARAGTLTDSPLGIGGFGSGNCSGITDTQRVVVARGACLFDPDSGDAVGVQTKTTERYAFDRGGGRWSVYVGNAWGLRQLDARDLAAGTGTPRWQPCD